MTDLLEEYILYLPEVRELSEKMRVVEREFDSRSLRSHDFTQRYICSASLYVMIRHFKPRIVVEVGTGAGWHLLWMLHALRKNGEGYAYSFEIRSWFAKETTALVQRKGFADICEIVWGDVTEGLPITRHMQPDSPIDTLRTTLNRVGKADFVSMDALHDYEFGRWWTSMILPLLNEKCVIAVDNTGTVKLPRLPENYQHPEGTGEAWAVKDFVEAHPEFVTLSMQDVGHDPRIRTLQQLLGSDMSIIYLMREKFESPEELSLPS